MQTRFVISRPALRPALWIVDSHQWPRACLRAELIERGYDACGFVSLDDAIEALSQQTMPKPDAVVLELRDQSFTKEMLETIHALKIPTVLLGGVSEFNDPAVQKEQWSAVLQRPFSLGAVADRVQQLVRAKQKKS